MKEMRQAIGIVLVIILFVAGLLYVGFEAKKYNTKKSNREDVRFQKDSLQMEYYKKTIKEN